MLSEILFAAAVALLAISYYVALYGARKKTLKDWRTDRGMLLSLLAQNLLLFVAIGFSLLARRVWFYDTIILAAQTILFIFTAWKAYRVGRLWALPVAVAIVVLHFIVYA